MDRSDNKILSILNGSVLKKLENNKFTGKLKVEWKEGVIKYFDLVTRMGFKDDDYDECVNWFDDDDF